MLFCRKLLKWVTMALEPAILAAQLPVAWCSLQLRGAGADGAELLHYLHSWSPTSSHSWHVTAGTSQLACNDWHITAGTSQLLNHCGCPRLGCGTRTTPHAPPALLRPSPHFVIAHLHRIVSATHPRVNTNHNKNKNNHTSTNQENREGACTGLCLAESRPYFVATILSLT